MLIFIKFLNVVRKCLRRVITSWGEGRSVMGHVRRWCRSVLKTCHSFGTAQEPPDTSPWLKWTEEILTLRIRSKQILMWILALCDGCIADVSMTFNVSIFKEKWLPNAPYRYLLKQVCWKSWKQPLRCYFALKTEIVWLSETSLITALICVKLSTQNRTHVCTEPP